MGKRTYARNYYKYQKMESYHFKENATQEEVIAKLMKFSKEKKEIQHICNDIIEEYIGQYEKHPENLNEEAYRRMENLMYTFRNSLADGGAIEFSIIYRICKLLLVYYEQKQSPEDMIRIFFKIITAEDMFSSHMAGERFSVYRNQLGEYMQYYDKVSESGKNDLLDAYAGELVQVNESVREAVSRYKKIRAFVYPKLKELRRNKYIEASYASFLYNSISSINSMKVHEDEEIRQGKKRLEDATDLLDYKEEMTELLQELGSLSPKEKMYQDYLITKTYMLCTAYYLHEISIEELLEKLRELAVVKPEYKEEKQWIALCYVNCIYIECLYLYSPKPQEEILRESEEIIDYVMEEIQKLPKKSETFTINFCIMAFINVASYLVDYTKFKNLVLDITVYANKALYAHTMMVREISEVLLKYILDNDIDFLNGVAGYEVSYIAEHKQEIIDILGDCSLLHDIGKYFCLDYTSISHRRLTEEEFQVIKRHPENFEAIYKGAVTPVAKCVRDCAVMHHVWYNEMGGYPKRKHTENKPFVNILSIADSIDAALDSIGRPYGEGKTLDDLIAEFDTMRDTRYSSKVIDALHNPSVKEQIELLLKVRQKEIHYNAHMLVK